MKQITERNTQIAEYAKKHPCYTLDKIGEQFGISKQRVYQILRKLNLRSRHSEFVIKKYCQNCGKRLTYKNKSGYCHNCIKTLHLKRVPLSCSKCGKITYRLPSTVIHHTKMTDKYKQGLVFCNRTCFAAYMGINYGAKALAKYHESKKVSQNIP